MQFLDAGVKSPLSLISHDLGTSFNHGIMIIWLIVIIQMAACTIQHVREHVGTDFDGTHGSSYSKIQWYKDDNII